MVKHGFRRCMAASMNTPQHIFADSAFTTRPASLSFCKDKIRSTEWVTSTAMSALRKMRKRTTSFAVFVASGQFHMRWINTTPSLAKMINLQFLRDWAVSKFPSKSMCACRFIVPPIRGISISAETSCPNPAFAVVVNFFLKTFWKRFERMYHGVG